MRESENFVLVPVAVFDSPAKFNSLCQVLWGKDAACGLDAHAASCDLMGEGGLGAAVVVVGPDGKVVHRGGDPKKGNSIYSGAGEPTVAFAETRKGVESLRNKGLLGGLKVPASAKPVVQILNAGKIADASALLERFPDKGETAEFKAELTKRIEELRAGKRALFDSLLSSGKDWDAYKVGASYERCFPKAKDVSDVKSKLSALKGKATVKGNLDAKDMFTRTAFAMYGSKSSKAMNAQGPAVMQNAMKKYQDTEFAEHSK